MVKFKMASILALSIWNRVTVINYVSKIRYLPITLNLFLCSREAFAVIIIYSEQSLSRRDQRVSHNLFLWQPG